MSETTSRLEQRYRRLLRLLPAGYRALWQEEMVTTFLASMHTDDAEEAEYLADYGRPSWSELASVVALAVRLRLGGQGAPARSVVWGDAVRLVALIGLFTQAVGTLIGLRQMLWLTGVFPWLPPLPPELEYVVHAPWFHIGALAETLWLPAFFALLVGRRRLSWILAVVALLVGHSMRLVNDGQPFTVSTAAFLLFDAIPVVALAAFHRDAPPVRWRRWLIALPIGAVAETTLIFAVFPLMDPPWWLDLPALSCVALVGATAVHLVRRRRDPAWSLALALFALAVLGLRAVTLLDYVSMTFDDRATLLSFGIAETGAVVAVGVPLAIVAWRALRRLPTTAV